MVPMTRERRGFDVKAFWDEHRPVVIGGFVVLVVLASVAIWFATRDTSETLDPALAQVTLESCSNDGAMGTVENLSDRDVTPVVEVRFLDADNELIQKGSVTRPGMEAGETVGWEVPFRADLVEGSPVVDACDVDVPTLFKFSR